MFLPKDTFAIISVAAEKAPPQAFSIQVRTWTPTAFTGSFTGQISLLLMISPKPAFHHSRTESYSCTDEMCGRGGVTDNSMCVRRFSLSFLRNYLSQK